MDFYKTLHDKDALASPVVQERSNSHGPLSDRHNCCSTLLKDWLRVTLTRPSPPLSINC